jgi:PAS domain S-box-containing protein
MSSRQTVLLHSKTLTEGILSFMEEGFMVFNSRNYVEIVNDAAARILGATPDMLIGKHLSELYVYGDVKQTEAYFATLEEQGSSQAQETLVTRADGRKFIGSYVAKMLEDTDGTGRKKMVLFRDITAEKKAAEKLAQYTVRLEKNNKELDQFAYIVSHDLKAPLRAISNLSLWLQEDLGGTLSEENKNNLTLLRNRVKRMESLINGILDYSKVGRDQMPSARIDMIKLLGEVLELLSPPVHIKVDIAREMPVLEAPKIMLLQVFSNLIGNAIKYNDKKDGLIKVYSAEKADSYEFTIEDNGPGIAPEYHEKIFIIFQTLQSRDKFESTGIGLTIVKRILDERGGKIWVESHEGKGSKFIFDWPKTKDRVTI